MIYSAHSDAKIEVGNWPQFFKCVFHVYAKSESDAKAQAERSLNKANVSYKNLHVEFIGRRYKVSSNEEFKVASLRYPADSVKEVHILPNTMQICIDCVRNGEIDHDNICVWCRPSDFKEAVDEVFSKMGYKEI